MLSLSLLISLVVLCSTIRTIVCENVENNAIRPRNSAPQFKAKSVIDDKFKDISLADYAARGQWVVLLFYPYDYTFVCPTEIISFSERNEEFTAINAQVLAISTDSHHTHLAWTRSKREDGGVGRLNIPLVADTSKKISASYGVLVTDESDDMFGAALRGLFIIDPEGIIRSIQINDDAVGRSVEETLRILKAFQWADGHVGKSYLIATMIINVESGHTVELRTADMFALYPASLKCVMVNGEACPASWTPGKDTIKTNPYESKEYFKAHYAGDTL